MDETRDLIKRGLEGLDPSADGREKILRRIRRRERNSRLLVGGLSLFLTAALAVGLWTTFLRPKPQREALPAGIGDERALEPTASPNLLTSAGPRLFLAGDGEMWIVDAKSGAVDHVVRPELTPGDAPHRIVRRGDKLVLWGYKTYVLDPASNSRPEVLAHDSLIFVPAAAADSVWVGVEDPNSPETERGLASVREISIDGSVTSPSVAPPSGRWPVAAVDGGLVFETPDGGLEVWDARTGATLRELSGPFTVASSGNLLAWCELVCATLHVTNVRSGEEAEISLEAPYEFVPNLGVFSPDGTRIAVPILFGTDTENPKWRLAVVDLRNVSMTVVGRSTTGGDYVFVDWSPSGEQIFMSGQDPDGKRTILEYEVRSRDVRLVRVNVGVFYGMAAA